METFEIACIITIFGAVLPSLNREEGIDYNIFSGIVNLIILSLIVYLGMPEVGWTFGQLTLITIIFAAINAFLTMRLAGEVYWQVGYTIVLAVVLILMTTSGYGESLIQQVQ